MNPLKTLGRLSVLNFVLIPIGLILFVILTFTLGTAGGIVGGILIILFAGALLASFTKECPVCKAKVSFHLGDQGVNCPACSQRLIVRSRNLYTLEQIKTQAP